MGYIILFSHVEFFPASTFGLGNHLWTAMSHKAMLSMLNFGGSHLWDIK